MQVSGFILAVGSPGCFNVHHPTSVLSQRYKRTTLLCACLIRLLNFCHNLIEHLFCFEKPGETLGTQGTRKF
jgi:hypothetical protein